MTWNIDFIAEKDFETHVANTIEHYGDKLASYDLEKLNRNHIDPVKMVFDKAVYNVDWETLIANEIFRQRDKSNNNEIGYFHQRIFAYMANCEVPPNGQKGGWDVIVDFPDGLQLGEGDVVHKVFVEMKNKFNTMNSASAAKTYLKAQNKLLNDDDCACFLVEAIAKESQNIKWCTTVDGNKVSHKRIRRVSLDRFYSIVTGEDDAFFKICLALPQAVQAALSDSDIAVTHPNDTAYMELAGRARRIIDAKESMSMYLALYLLGFGSYLGFGSIKEAPDNS